MIELSNEAIERMLHKETVKKEEGRSRDNSSRRLYQIHASV